jgi:hypothetical protein
VSFIYRSNLDLKIDALVSRSEHTPFWCRCRGSRVSDGRVITWRSWIKPLGAAAALAGVLYSEPHLLQQIWIPWRSLSSPKHPSFIPVKKNPSFILLAPDPWRSSISASAIRFYPPHPQYNSATKHSRSSVPRRPDVLLSSPALFCLSSGFSFSAVVPRCSRCYSTMFSHSFFPIEVIIVYSTHCSNCCSACAVRVIEGRALMMLITPSSHRGTVDYSRASRTNPLPCTALQRRNSMFLGSGCKWACLRESRIVPHRPTWLSRLTRESL